MSKDTGGPAFPLTNDRVVGALSVAESQGMTLRDYFAAKAMQGLLASDVEASMPEFARRSYQMADEMLEARNDNN